MHLLLRTVLKDRIGQKVFEHASASRADAAPAEIRRTDQETDDSAKSHLRGRDGMFALPKHIGRDISVWWSSIRCPSTL